MPSTGRKRYREYDENPNSPTFGQSRWGAYVNDPTACPPSTRYTSIEVSGYVSRDNCPSGQATEPILYTVPLASFTSYVSQADANTQAQDYFDSTKQAYANANGICGTRRVTISSVVQSFRKVTVSITRTATDGAVDVVLYVQVTREDLAGGPGLSDSLTRTVTMADGASQATAEFLFTTNVQTVDDYSVQSTDPSNYTF